MAKFFPSNHGYVGTDDKYELDSVSPCEPAIYVCSDW